MCFIVVKLILNNAKKNFFFDFRVKCDPVLCDSPRKCLVLCALLRSLHALPLSNRDQI